MRKVNLGCGKDILPGWINIDTGAEIFIRVPHSSTQEAFYPDHKSYWNEKMVQAMVSDWSQKGTYTFEITSMQRSGIELQVRLKKK